MKGSSDTDAIGFFGGEVKSCFVVLHYIQGQLLGKNIELLDDPLGDGIEGLSLLVRQFYIDKESIPKTVLLPEDTGDMEELSRFLSERAGHNVDVYVPQRGINRDYMNAAAVNAREEVERRTTAEERVTKTAQWLMDALKLPRPPVRIESFDISNTGNDDIVASMVVFDHGRPLKRAYKKFKMKTITGTDDYGSMRETITRRFTRYKSGDVGFAELPDLLLIDGGAAHATAATEAMEATGISLPVFGMVKDDRHRTRALITADGEEIGISGLPSVFSFIGNIQEETHRFAIEYHRTLRSKRVRKSKLDDIPGVGDKRKAELLKYFKSIKAIEEASIEELNRVVPKNTAQAIYLHFHSESGE
jgi:excinuclease ABC subunit C